MVVGAACFHFVIRGLKITRGGWFRDDTSTDLESLFDSADVGSPDGGSIVAFGVQELIAGSTR